MNIWSFFSLAWFWARRTDFLVKSSNVSSPHNTNELESGWATYKQRELGCFFWPILPQAALCFDWFWCSITDSSVKAGLKFLKRFQRKTIQFWWKKIMTTWMYWSLHQTLDNPEAPKCAIFLKYLDVQTQVFSYLHAWFTSRRQSTKNYLSEFFSCYRNWTLVQQTESF